MPVIKRCEKCRKDYAAAPCKAEASRFCSRACKDASYQDTRKQLTCERCEKGYALPPSHAKGSRFCSRTCADARESKSQKKCSHCGEVKPLSDFRSYTYKNDRSRVYYTGKCKPCLLEYGRALIARKHPNRKKINRKYIDPASGEWFKKCPRCNEVKPLEKFKMSHR